MKIVSIVGARPQFIKCAPRCPANCGRSMRGCCCIPGSTTTMRWMSEIFFEELNIQKPITTFGIGSGSHGEQTWKMLIEI